MAQEFDYERLHQEALAKALRDLGLSEREFALLTGTRRATVSRWLLPSDDPQSIAPPFWVTQFLALACLPGGLERVNQVARLHARKRDHARS